MSRRKVAASTFIASALAAFAVGPFAAQGASATPVGTGTTSTVVDLVEVDLTNVPVVGNVGASLGSISSDATNSGTPASSIGITAIRAAGQTHGRSVTSGDGSSQDVSVPLDAAGISGLLSIVEMSATATDDTAEAIMSVLNGDINIGPLGMGTSIPENGIRSFAGPKVSTSSMGATFGPIVVGLGDLVPADLLGQLPLGTVLNLVDSLGIDLPAGLDDQLKAVTDLLDTVDGLNMVMGQLKSAQKELKNLTKNIPSVQAAQDVVDTAQAAVVTATAALDGLMDQISAANTAFSTASTEATNAQATIDTITAQITGAQTQKAILEGQLAACGAVPAVCAPIQAQLDTVNASIATYTTQLTAAQGALSAAQAAMATAQAQINTATAGVPAAQAAVDSATTQLDAAQAALDAAIAGASTPQMDAILGLIDTLTAQIEALLTQIDGLLGNMPDLDSLLDSIVGLLGDAPIFSINEITASVQSAANANNGTASVVCEASGISVLGNAVGGGGCNALTGAFDELRNAVDDVLGSLPIGNVVPKITFEGLSTSSSGSDAPDASGVTQAVAKLTALHVKVPTVSLKDVVDDVIATAIATVEDAISQLPTTVPVPVDIQTVIDEVMAQLTALPIGDTLGGLKTMGIDASLASMSSRSSFQARAPQATPNDPSDPDPSNPDPAVAPQPRSDLPFTGSPISLVFALGLWFTIAGMLAMFVTQRKAFSKV